jgi:hypothetical protein
VIPAKAIGSESATAGPINVAIGGITCVTRMKIGETGVTCGGITCGTKKIKSRIGTGATATDHPCATATQTACEIAGAVNGRG